MLNAFLRWLGFGLCHQLPERSYFGGGLQAPVCARDTGIYVGFAVSLVLLMLLHRRRVKGFPRPYVWVFMGAALAFMGWDGVSSYAGFRETVNGLRAITGLGVGFSAAVIILPMLNDELWVSADRSRVLDPAWRFAAWLVAIPVTWLVVDLVGPLSGVVYVVFIAICIVLTLTAINLVIIAMLPPFDRAASTWRQVLTPAALALGLSFAEIALAAQLRVFLLALAARL